MSREFASKNGPVKDGSQAKHEEYVFIDTEFGHGISREPLAILKEITILDVHGEVLVDAFIDWE